MDDQLETLALQLESEYCPPLDSALVRAILSDYDHHQPEQVQAVRNQLDEFKSFAAVEEATGFDPSGSSGQAAGSSSPERDRNLNGHEDTTTESGFSQSGETDTTSLSNDLSSLRLEQDHLMDESNQSGESEYMEDMEQLDIPTKERHLKEIFPTESASTISYTLAKCDGGFGRATDVLLNHHYFQEAGTINGGEKVSIKGVDAFFEGNTLPRGRKGRGKRKNGQHADLPARSSSVPASYPAPSTPNKWQATSKDVDFISSRTNIPAQTVFSLYRNTGSSLPATITALLDANVREAGADPPADPEAQFTIVTLLEAFPALSIPHATALTRLTHPSQLAAHDLASALAAPPASSSTPHPPSDAPVHIIPHYAPLDLSPSAPSTRPASPSRHHHSALPASATPPTAAALAHARSAALAQASAAHRKARSDALMGAAAAYYGGLGQAYGAAARAAAAAEADALAAAQSGPAFVDLHGVGVRDAQRIAAERVRAWWAGLGEARTEWGRARGGAADGFRIVTGVGRHSEDGVGKLGPAVARMLVRDGWKVEVGRGEILVKGVVRRK